MSPSIEKIHEEEEMNNYGYMIKCHFIESPEEGEDVEDRYDLSYVYEEYNNITKNYPHTFCNTSLDISDKSLQPDDLKPLEKDMDFSFDDLINFVIENKLDIFYIIFNYEK
jgi:hypothetical protein